MNHEVLCIARSALPKEWLQNEGALAITAPDLSRQIQTIPLSWIDRQEAEQNPNFKQIIPYVLVKDAQNKLAVYPRSGTENRLHSFYSLGIGGHVDKIPDQGRDFLETLKKGIQRELAEEIYLYQKDQASSEFLGVINEETTEVGIVHLGFVFLVYCKKSYQSKASDETKGLDWISERDASSVKLEIWSNLALQLYKNSIHSR